MPKVSIIIPVYGVEKHIARCARALFEQTLDDIEYLFIDDCSPDNSVQELLDVIKDYPHRREQIIIHRMNQNSGQAKVREWGMKNASGEYIIHCDSDDWIDVNMYQLMYEKAVNENLDIVWCDYYRTNGITNEYIDLSIQPRLMQGPLWNKLVKRRLYINNEIIFPSDNKAEDGALMTQISYYAKSRGYIAKPLYYYYINPNSICCQSSEEACLDKLNQEVNNTNLKIEFLKNLGVIDLFESDILKWKLMCRENLRPLLHLKKYRKLWRNTYKEINIRFFTSKNITLKGKIRFMLLLLNPGFKI